MGKQEAWSAAPLLPERPTLKKLQVAAAGMHSVSAVEDRDADGVRGRITPCQSCVRGRATGER